MKHKSKQVLDLEKALGFELEDQQFEVDKKGDITQLNLSNKGKATFYYREKNSYFESELERLRYSIPIQVIIDDVFATIEFPRLSVLNVSVCSLQNLNFISKIQRVEKLSAWGNHLNDCRDLSNNRTLQNLDLSKNFISDINGLQNLNLLKEVCLSDNALENLNLLIKLRNLKTIYIDFNEISNVEVFEKVIESMPNTGVIGILENPIDRLTKLVFNHIIELITKVPDSGISLIRKFKNHIVKSQRYETAAFVRDLEKKIIEKVIFSAKEYLFFLNKIFTYSLIERDLISPPKEVIEQGYGAITTYFEEQEKVENSFKIGVEITDKIEVPLNEVRVIFLGWGQTGKTTLKKQLLGLPIPETETQTDGIDIDVWQPETLDGIKLRLWDFGGQEIQHSVHKLFLQDNCVYVLLVNKRQDPQSEGNLIYWLDHIRSFGKNSPILIAENFIDTVNGIDEHTTAQEIEQLVGLRNEILRKYEHPNAPIDYVGISAKKGYNLATFKEKLFHWAAQENNRGQYSPRWLAAKSNVEERITGGTEFGGLARNNYITKETFDLECQQVEIVDPVAQNTILGVMLRLGIAFYFKKSESRKNWLILNPEWVTVGIYSLLLHPKVKELNGRLLKSDLEEILINEAAAMYFSKKNYTYSEDELGYLLGLMQDFELCYTPDGNEYFMPVGFVRNYNSQFRTENPDAVAFFIAYDTLPQAIWFKFLVRLFKRKLVRKYWQEGIEITTPDASGLVEFLPLLDKKIKLWVSGKTADTRLELLRLLRYELDFVNEEFSNIQPTPKLFTEDGTELSYADLLAALYQNEPLKKGFASFNPLPMIQAVDLPEQTLINVFLELQKTNQRMDVFERGKNEFLIQIAEQLQKSGVINLIVNQNSNININENRFELPRETNAFEGKLNFLIEELKDKKAEQELLQELLQKIEELRLVPTKEDAVKKGFLERFKKFSEYMKSGTDFAKSLKEIGNMVSIEDIKQGIELILESMK